MQEFALAHEGFIRSGFFFGIFIAIALWEKYRPKRPLTASIKIRWFSNIGIVFINSALVRTIFPIMAVGIAVVGEEKEWGLLNNINFPYWIKNVLAVIFLDFVIYMQHVMVHAVPLLWRLHLMHHTDLDFDVTTGSRFHPIEIIFSMVVKMFVVAALGASAVAVITFEILLNGTSMFNHGNINIPIKVDRFLRFLVVTPDMHRVHHSVKPTETNSNFGFNLPWWDRLFGTYRDQPEEGHKGMTIGLNQFRNSKYLILHWLLILPFLSKAEEYPITGRK